MSYSWPFDIEFPPVGPDNLVRLAEDWLRPYSALRQLDSWHDAVAADRKYISSISDLISRNGTSPQSLSPGEAAALEGTFREAVSVFSSSTARISLLSPLRLRLYTHALLRESRVFPNLELCDEFPDYTPFGFADIWKGNYHGEPVYIKAIRTREWSPLREIKRTFRREINGRKSISHPNVLPVIEVSNTLVPFCIMSPWMPDGNIIQYTKMNPGANRLLLLAQACQGLMHLHGLGILHGNITPSNILITRGGQACLGDFGILGEFRSHSIGRYMLGSFRYTAPERFLDFFQKINGPSKGGDVYSLAMTSFEVLTGILPYHDSDEDSLITDIRCGKRPSRPTDPGQNRWLQDRVWDVIVTCWSDKPQQRYELSVVYHVFLTPSCQDALVELPPVGRKNLVLLAEELSYAFLILHLDLSERAALGKMQKYISNVVSWDGAPPTSLSSAELTALVETFRKITSILSAPLRPPPFRLWFRLYTHALLLESRIFPNIELHDESLGYMPTGFTDIWKGKVDGGLVCIKAFRTQDPIRLREIESTFYYEADGREPISHPNVLPIIDISETIFPLCIMSPWMPDGNVIQYIRANPDANRLVLITQVCRGLMYLHGLDILHGWITPGNILITQDGQACLADFGIAGAFRGLPRHDHKLETLRHMAPERFSEDIDSFPIINGPTKAGDVYSLAITSFEVLTGTSPDDGDEANTVTKIRPGRRPSRPLDPSQNRWLLDRVWDVIETCWSDKPERRYELPVVCHVFSTPSCQDSLVEFPPAGRENLIRLAGELLYTFSILPLDPGERATLRTMQEYISDVVSRDGTSPTSLSPAKAAALVGTFHKATSILSSRLRPPSFRLWFRLCTHALLLESRIFPDIELHDESLGYVPTGFTDIWKGKFDGEPVCVKAIRTQDPIRLREIESTFYYEADGREPISHPNVLSIIDVSETTFPLCIMTPWMSNGNIIQYIRANPDANRLTLLAQACQGLMYLHGLDILHGGVTPGNILITQDGQACIADFGSAFRDLTPHGHKLETLRYMAPERRLDDLPISGPSKAGDVYSFAMTSFEVLTGIPPDDDDNKATVIADIRPVRRPSRPLDPSQNRWLLDRVWDVIETCWSDKPERRYELPVVCHVFLTPSCQDALFESPPVGRENLIRLAGELLYTFSILPLDPGERATLRTMQEYISKAISRGGTSPANLSSTEAAALAETSREATSILSSHLRSPSFRLWFRLYTHTLLLESQIFPNIELSNEPLSYVPTGFTDIWKGNYHGKPVCIKAIRTQDPIRLREIESTFYYEADGREPISHPNVLPIIDVSETIFPLCIMTPWMPNGNILQYTQANPDANRLMLLAQACQGLMYLHGLGILHGGVTPGNILITQDGQACLADFGSAFRDLTSHDHKLETLQYMAPEHCLEDLSINGPSKTGDVYSFTMTSFKVLTGISPDDGDDRVNAITNIRLGRRPFRPLDPSQNRWLQDRVWNVIVTCWSDKPEQRCGLSIVYHIFSTPNCQDALVEFPPVGHKNLIRLAEELSYTFSILPLNPGERATLRTMQEHISKVISGGGTSPTSVSSVEAAALAGTLRRATSILSSHLRPPSFRLWLRLYAHTLILESRIFPNMKLSNESPSYMPTGFTDIWKGNYHGEPVCIKAIRTQDPIRLREIESTYRRETNGRKPISHPNILPIIKVSDTPFPLCIMSPWMPDGNIIQYTQRNPDANRLALLAQVCQGLMHLHESGVLHGSVTPRNILITRDGQACIADFGIASVFRDVTHHDHKLETLRHMAPERFSEDINSHPIINSPSKPSDVYSFAITSFEVLTGILPYNGCNKTNVAVDISLGERPSRPLDLSQNQWLSDPIWDTITTCWSDKPEQRYELIVVHQVFSRSSRQGIKRGIETGLQQRGNFLPRIASLFQFLRESEPEIERSIGEMDKRLGDNTLSAQERLKLLNKLCKTCSRHRVIPKSMHIPDCSKGSVEAERGGFADVSQGVYQGRRVAIKVVRVCLMDDLDGVLSRFCREGVAWKHLRHPNVLPLLGVTVSERRFAMVSEWMDHGNINEFIKEDRHVNRAELLVDVANGLVYMHGLRMVHGDLKGANILIKKDRRACLADFGLSTITGVTTHAAAGASQVSLISNDTLMSFTSGGTRRWMSPELLDPELFGIPQSEGDRPTRQSDCYALGMVIYEVLCGHYPYIEIQSDIMVIRSITGGIRPEKPEGAKRLGFSNELWRTVELCWLEDRNARPRVEDILSSLNDATAFWHMRDF